jgi:hypothetical protein
MLRRMLIVLVIVLGGALCASVWATAHRVYAGVVYYRRLALTDSSPYWSLGTSAVIEEWQDRQHHRQRTKISGLASAVDVLVRDGATYYNSARAQAVFADSWTSWLFARGCAHGVGATTHLDIGSGYVATVQCIPYRRLAAGALSADFFDPPRQSLWESALRWARERL